MPILSVRKNLRAKKRALGNVLKGFFDLRGVYAFNCAVKGPIGRGRVLLVGASSDFQTPSAAGTTSERLMYWFNSVLAEGFTPEVGLSPFAGRIGKQVVPIPFRPEASLYRARYRSRCRIGKFKEHSTFPWKHLFRLLRWKIWANTIEALKPVAVIGIGLDSDLVRICRNSGIPTIEIQHGIWTTGVEETLFQYWPEHENGSRLIPNLICTWEKTYTKHAQDKGFDAINCGFQVRDFGKMTDVPKSVDVVITASWGRADSVDPFGMIEPSLNEAILSLSGARYQIAIRTHPVAEKNLTEKKLFRVLTELYPGVNIVFPSKETIEVSLRRGSLHLTQQSAACVDAALLGVPSLCLSEPGNLLFPQGMIDEGWITFGSVADAIEILRNPARSDFYILASEPISFTQILSRLQNQ